MKNIFRIIVAFIFVAGLSSCEKVIKVEVPEGETLLVVDAWINDKQGKQTVRLTTTAPVFEANNTPIAVGAAVVLKDLTNGKSYVFNEVAGTGNYEFVPSTTDTLAVLNHQYSLSVSYKGNSYTALSTLNRTTTIDTVGFDRITEPGSTEVKGYLAWLFGKDQPNGKDYYWIKSFKNGEFYNQSSSINVSEDGGGGDGTDGLCFIPPTAFFNVIPGSKNLKLNDVYTVEVHSLNKDSYEYMVQLTTQLNNSQAGLFAVTPENLRTNLKAVNEGAPRALGWFNMGMVSTKSFICLDIPYENIYAGGYYCP
jgi:hypothetical protein